MKGQQYIVMAIGFYGVLGVMACSNITRIEVDAGYAAIAPELADSEVSPGSGSITLELIAPETAGCVDVWLNDGEEKEQKGAFRCAIFPLTADDGAEVDAAYEGMQTSDGKKQKIGLILASYGATLKLALEKRLGERFGTVNVSRKDEPSGDALGVAYEGTIYREQ